MAGRFFCDKALHIESEQRITNTGAAYLGRRHIVNSAKLPAGATVTTMTYDMDDFLKPCIERYRAVVGVQQQLRNYSTPFWPRIIRMLRQVHLDMDRSKSAIGVTTRDPRLHSVVTLMRISFLIDEKRRRRRLPEPMTLRSR